MPDLNQNDYNAAYEAEIKRLEEEAAKATTSETEVSTEPANTEAAADATGKTKDEPREEDPLAVLTKRLESTEKALNDTKAYATRNAQELARMKKEREAKEREANRPAILDDNPGLEEAVRHVTGVKSGPSAEERQEAWTDAVATALPDIDAMLTKSPEFRAKAKAVAEQLGADWDNPVIAIRELNKLQIEALQAETAESARVQAARDFAQRSKKQGAMGVPSGTGTRAPAAAPAKDYATMSSADFEKERRKTLGFS